MTKDYSSFLSTEFILFFIYISKPPPRNCQSFRKMEYPGIKSSLSRMKEFKEVSQGHKQYIPKLVRDKLVLINNIYPS